MVYNYLLYVKCRILSWQLSQGIQSIPESSLQYANDNALLLAKVLMANQQCHLIFIIFSLFVDYSYINT